MRTPGTTGTLFILMGLCAEKREVKMKDLMEKLLPVIREAGRIMTGARNIEGAVDEKGGDAANMVTAYDVAVQAHLMAEITKLIPEAFFFAEEKENNAADLQREHCFVIDPIDGTANFVHDYKHSCISVAMFSRGGIKLAAVYDPYLDEMFSAVKDGGAYLNGKPMKVSARDIRHATVAFGTCPYYKDTLGEKTFELCYELYRICSDVRRPGAAALDLAYLAAGRNDAFFELRLSPWDIAAGDLLIREAGGIITDGEGRDIDFSAPSAVFAAAPNIYGEFFRIAKEILSR